MWKNDFVCYWEVESEMRNMEIWGSTLLEVLDGDTRSEKRRQTELFALSWGISYDVWTRCTCSCCAGYYHYVYRPERCGGRRISSFKEEALSKDRLFAYNQQFMKDPEPDKNMCHDRPPYTSITDNNIPLVKKLLEGDICLMVIEMANEVGPDYGCNFSIITVELGFGKKCARWVPCLEAPEQILNRFQVCYCYFAKFQNEWDSFLKHIVNTDKICVHRSTPESKQASKK